MVESMHRTLVSATFWLLSFDLHRNDYFPKLDRWLKNISSGKYEKNRTDMFSVLEPYMNDAIKNATHLQQQNNDQLPSNSKPGTKVYELIEMLKPYV